MSAEMRKNVLHRRRWGATGNLIFNYQKDDALESSKFRSEDSLPPVRFLRTQLQMLAPAFAGEGLFSQWAIDHRDNAPVTDGAINHGRRKSRWDPRPLSHLHHSCQLHSEPTVSLNSVAAATPL